MCSYYQVASDECRNVTINPNEAEICIDDPINFIKAFRVRPPTCRLWGDTMADPEHYRDLSRFPEFDVTSRWNYDYFRRAGFHVGEIKPRHIFPVSVNLPKDITFITVGVSRYFDRKNISAIGELGIRSNTFIISNFMIVPALRDGKLVKMRPVVTDLPAFSLKKEDLNKYYARSRYYVALSVSEGFGLPPLEASFHGAIPIFTNGHAFRENLVGLPVDVKNEYSIEISGYVFRVWEPDLRQAKSIVEEILNGKMREVEEDLRVKVRENAKRFLPPKANYSL